MIIYPPHLKGIACRADIHPAKSSVRLQPNYTEWAKFPAN